MCCETQHEVVHKCVNVSVLHKHLVITQKFMWVVLFYFFVKNFVIGWFYIVESTWEKDITPI